MVLIVFLMTLPSFCCSSVEEDTDTKPQVPLPVRRDRLREVNPSSSSNKENDGHCDSLTGHYIAELVREGYDKNFATRALTISENNIEMARNILKEFVYKK